MATIGTFTAQEGKLIGEIHPLTINASITPTIGPPPFVKLEITTKPSGPKRRR